MNFEENHVYHIFNRGINKNQTFYTSRNYEYFLQKVKEIISPYSNILAYCLMPNHFHFLIRASKESCNYLQMDGKDTDKMQILSKKIGIVLGSYTQGLNRQHDRSGSLWSQRTKAIELNRFNDASEYLESCFHYIHQNPTRAGLTKKMGDWPYSSYHEFQKRSTMDICQVDQALAMLNKTPLEFLIASRLVKENRDLKSFLYYDSEPSA
jgi:REP element-mobilizing transposase RayT